MAQPKRIIIEYDNGCADVIDLFEGCYSMDWGYGEIGGYRNVEGIMRFVIRGTGRFLRKQKGDKYSCNRKEETMNEKLNLNNYSELFFKVPVDSKMTYDEAKRLVGCILYIEGGDALEVTSISDDDDFVYINVEKIDEDN